MQGFNGSMTIIGTLGSDPALRFSEGGVANLKFGIAVSEKSKDGVQSTYWLDVTCFNTLAENAAATLKKGDKVLVYGKPEPIEFEKKDGSGKVQKLGILADEVCPSLRWNSAEIQRSERASTPRAAAPKQGELVDPDTAPF